MVAFIGKQHPVHHVQCGSTIISIVIVIKSSKDVIGCEYANGGVLTFLCVNS